MNKRGNDDLYLKIGKSVFAIIIFFILLNIINEWGTNEAVEIQAMADDIGFTLNKILDLDSLNTFSDVEVTMKKSSSFVSLELFLDELDGVEELGSVFLRGEDKAGRLYTGQGVYLPVKGRAIVFEDAGDKFVFKNG